MQLLFDFLPVITFFVAYQITQDIFVATAVIIVATILQVSIHWYRKRRVNVLHLVSAGLVLILGGLTIAFRNPHFIMWKVTVVNWLLAVVFLASQWRMFGGRPLVERLMQATGGGIQLTATQWRRLNLAWVVFFVLVGFANLLAFKLLSESAWVNFKMYGLMGLTIAFVLAQGFWIASRTQSDQMSAH